GPARRRAGCGRCPWPGLEGPRGTSAEDARDGGNVGGRGAPAPASCGRVESPTGGRTFRLLTVLRHVRWARPLVQALAGGSAHFSLRGRPRGRFDRGSAGGSAAAFGGRPRFGSGTAAGSSRNARQVTPRASAAATGCRLRVMAG